MRVTKSDLSLELEFAVDELSPAQLEAYEKVANEHNAIKNALKAALNANEGKELFTGQVFQAYSFKGKVLQELKEATLPKKPPKAVEPPSSASGGRRKRASNYVYLESSDEGEDDVPLAKRIASGSNKKSQSSTPVSKNNSKKGSRAPSPSLSTKSKSSSKAAKAKASESEKHVVRPSEHTAVGGLVIGTEGKDSGGKDGKDGKETKLQGKTFPSLVVLAKPWLKVKDMSATRSKLDSKVKLVLMLTPNKFTEWLIQEGLLKSEQKCDTHPNNELKLGVYSDATKFPYTGGYVWISDCCSSRFVSVFHGSIFEAAPHPPSCILKLIYHWSCQTNIQNVVSWVKVDNIYIKGVYTWLRAVCTLAVHQKLKKLGGPDKYVEVGVISLGTTSQDGLQRQVKVEVLGVLDYSEKTIRLRAVEPVSDADRNYKKRFQTILEPLQRWVHKDSIISIDLTVDKMTLVSMGFKNIVQASATDTTAKHTNAAVMDYLRRIVPRMFQNTLSLLSRQMIQQFLDELVWREQFGTYALQAFNSITTHIAEQTRLNTKETLTQRLYQVATNPFKDWSILPANCKETPANTTPKRLKKPINDADYAPAEKVNLRNVKKEREIRDLTTPSPPPSKRGKRDDDYRPDKKSSKTSSSTKGFSSSAKASNNKCSSSTQKNSTSNSKSALASLSKKTLIDPKSIKKEEEETRGLEEMYYGICDGYEINFESFPYTTTTTVASTVPATEEGQEPNTTTNTETTTIGDTHVYCPICDITETYDSNEKLQTHLLSHISSNSEGKATGHQFQCLFCLEKLANETALTKHQQIMHPIETKATSSASFHCIICQQRFNNNSLLISHLHKNHSVLELPYCCMACGYRSSSHRDVVRHYYDDHKNHNFLQCPYCLDIFRFSYKGQVKTKNIEHFYKHLKQHASKKYSKYHCSKCALSFVERGAFKLHSGNHHVSLLKSSNHVRRLLSNSMLIASPKIKTHHREPLPYIMQSKMGDFYAFIDGSYCVECNSEVINEQHYPGLMKCAKCNYKSCCERAIYDHGSTCNGGIDDAMELPLPNEMHCICGFSTAIGNKMAQHLSVCGQKSAYTTVEMAQENTVKKSMLDMLGLVRRDDENAEGAGDGEAGSTTGEGEEQSAAAGAGESEDGAAVSENLSMSEVAAGDEVGVQQEQRQEQEPQQLDQSEAAPIQFGVMEAAPVIEAGTDLPSSAGDVVQYGHIVDNTSVVMQQQSQDQYALAFGQAPPETGIDMPLIADLGADPNQIFDDGHQQVYHQYGGQSQ